MKLLSPCTRIPTIAISSLEATRPRKYGPLNGCDEGAALCAFEVPEPERLIHVGPGLVRDGRELLFIQRREFARECNVLFELRDGIDADDDGADGLRQDPVHRLADRQSPGLARDVGAALPHPFLTFDGRRVPGGKDAAACRHFHSDDAHLPLHRKRNQLRREAVPVMICGVDAQQDRVERKTADTFHQCFRTMVSRDTQESNQFLIACLQERFHGAALAEHLVDVGHRADVVELPDVDMIGLEQPKRLIEHSERAIAGAILALRRDERFPSAALQDLPDVALTGALGSAIDRRSVDVVDAQFERPLHDRYGDRIVIWPLEGGLSTKAEHCDPISRLAEIPGRHGSGGGRRLALRHTARARSQRGGRDPSTFQERPAAFVNVLHGISVYQDHIQEARPLPRRRGPSAITIRLDLGVGWEVGRDDAYQERSQNRPLMWPYWAQ